MTIARGLQRLWRNELTTLLTQGGSHEVALRCRDQRPPPGTPRGAAEQDYFQRWRLRSRVSQLLVSGLLVGTLTSRPQKRRLLGEDVVLWRDGGQVARAGRPLPAPGREPGGRPRAVPGSGTLSCPYHGWTFDGRGVLRACIQEGPARAWSGRCGPGLPGGGAAGRGVGVDRRPAPVPVEDDLPVGMTVPGVHNFIHFTKVWRTNWALLFDNFIDGLHAPYVHRASPQFLLNRLPFRTVGVEPYFDAVRAQRARPGGATRRQARAR